MKNYKAFAMQVFLTILFIGGAIFTIAMPYVVIKVAPWYYGPDYNFWMVMISITLSAVLVELILFDMLRIISTVKSNTCFEHRNVKSLKRMAVYGVLISFISLMRMIVHWTSLSLAMILVFGVAAACAYTLALVFEQAINYKKENDLTI